MSNLTTRKIVLGLLMTLVLAFGVQEIAEAQSVSVSGDGATTSSTSGTKIVEGPTPVTRSFRITVSGAENDNIITIEGSAGVTITGITGQDALINDHGIVGPLDQQSVTITADAPNTWNDPTDDPDAGATEENPDWESRSVTLTVKYTIGAYGEYTVTVTANQIDTEITGSPIKAYVVQSESQNGFYNLTVSPPTTSGETALLRLGAERGGKTIVVTTSQPSQPWTKVTFSTSSGELHSSGTTDYYYVGSNRNLFQTLPSGSRSITAYSNGSSAIGVQYRATQNATATVTAQIPGSVQRTATQKVIIFYNGSVGLKRISGNNQFGPTNSSATAPTARRLTNPLVVRVLDGDTRGVSGQEVTFTINGANTGSAVLRAFSSALLADSTNDNSITNADNNKTPITVKTDNSGDAKVYVVPGSDAETYMIRASITGITPVLDPTAFTFTATAIQTRDDTSAYTIDRAESTLTPVVRDLYRDSEMRVRVTGDTSVSNVQVNFSVTGGRITRDEINPNYQTSLSTVTDSDGDATVYVQLNRGTTATVTARIDGTISDDRTHVVTYFYNYPHIEYVSGDNQRGATGGRLEDPLVVRVKDGQNGRAVPGQVVKFEETSTASPADSDVMRSPIPVPGETVYVDSDTPTDLTDPLSSDIERPDSLRTRIATSIVPAVANDVKKVVFVETGSDGQASVYLRLGRTLSGADPLADTTDVDHQVTASTPEGATGGHSQDIQFSATAVADAREGLLEIVSGDGQSADKHSPIPAPFVVRTRTVRGFLISGVTIRFTALDGTLVPEHGTSLAPGSPLQGGNEIEVLTNPDGTASVEYNIGAFVVGRQVTAEVVEERSAHQYDFEIDEVKFSVNGGRGGPAPAPAPEPAPEPRIVQVVVPPAEPRLIIEPASIVGTPSSEHEITIRAEDEHGVAVSVPSIAVGNLAFEQAGGSFNPGRTITPITGTLVLPNTPQRYEISAAAKDYKTAIASVRVAKGTLEITVPRQGAPGKSDTLRVTATDPVGDHPEDLAITLSVTTGGGTFASTTLTTNPGGYATTTFTRGSAPGQDYFISATATGYTDERVRIQIGGTPVLSTPTPTSTVSEPSSIEITGPSARSGTVNEELAAALIVRVLDDDGDGH